MKGNALDVFEFQVAPISELNLENIRSAFIFLALSRPLEA